MRPLTLLLLAALAPAACEGADPPRPAVPSSAAAAGDTTLTVAGPTFVALFPAVTQAAVDADGALAAALDDYRHHLADAAPVLRDAGVAVHEVAGRRVRLVGGEPPRALAGVNADQPRYVLIHPGRAPYVLDGVRTDADLLGAAFAYFRIPALRRYAR